MTSSTWRFETDLPLLGAGVDQVEIDRFEGLLRGEAHPMPFVFSKPEIDFARDSESPARCLSICFGCKEALMKAIGEPYDFTGCELFPREDAGAAEPEWEIELSSELKKTHGIRRASCRAVVATGAGGTVTSAVFAFGEVPP